MSTGKSVETEIKEQTFLFEKEPLATIRKAEDEIKTNIMIKNGRNDDSFQDNAALSEHAEIPSNQNIEISIWRNGKIQINKSLITLRAAQFLWFASGSICSPFFSLMLIRRGLKIKEFSPVFSVSFLFQLIVAYICGIITDKIGNAKPVLLCLMFGVIVVVIGLLLSPDMIDKSCLDNDSNNTGVNITCFNVFNYTADLENYKEACCTNSTDYFTIQAENKNKNRFSTLSNLTDILGSKQISEDALCSNDTDVFCNAIHSCFGQSTRNCSSVPKFLFKIFYSVLILTFYSLWSTAFRFLDFASLTAAKKHNSHFGNERFYGMLGVLLATVTCSFILNIDKSRSRGYYDNLFWFAVVLFTLALISAINIKGVILPPGLNLTKKTLKMFTNVEIVSVILVAFVAGTAFTFNQFYHLWYLDSLKASKLTISFHIMARPLYGIPMYLTCRWWLGKLGKLKVSVIGLLCYTINGISYSFLYHPWHAVIVEITRTFSFHLFWIATVTHCSDIAPKGFAATVNAIVGTVHFGVGRSFSLSVGGFLISTFGIRSTYRILASFCLVAAIMYSTFLYMRHLFCLRNSQKESKDPEEIKSMKENEV